MKSIFQILCFMIFFSSYSQLKVEIEKLSINTSNDEFAPTYFEDGLLITSNRKNSVVKSVIEVDKYGNEKFLNDVYVVSFKGSDSVQNSIKPFDINSIEIHDGPVSLYRDSVLVMTRMQQTQKGKKTKQTKLGLFFFIRSGNEWIQKGAFEHNSSSYTISQPAFSTDGNTLYFVSNMKGGIGGMDIWKCDKTQSGSWSKPINLGPNINTKTNDAFPYVTSDNILYFSSNRPGGQGGYDIYYTDLLTGNIHALETPINSDKDEFGLITNDNGHSGFFSTNRENGNDDIFFFRKTITLPHNCVKSNKTKMCYTFYDRNPLPENAKVEYIWNFGDSTVKKGPKLKHCYTSPGDYKISLSLFDSSSNFLTENSSVINLKIEESSKYYFEYDEKRSDDIHIAFLDGKSHNHVSNRGHTYWKVDNKTLYDHDELHFHPKYRGQYSIKGYLIEKNNLICISDTINVNETQKTYKKKTYFHLIYQSKGQMIPDEIRMAIFSNMSENPNQENYKIYVPESVSEEWKTNLLKEFKTITGKEIVIESNRKSSDLLLKIYE